MALIIAGERSGSGKTTVTLALLAYLCRLYSQPSHQVGETDLQVQSFKVGPDYIDPMFHRYVTHRPCRNLDPILTSESYVQHCFAQHSQTADMALIEGVMGLFDGASGSSDRGSTAHVARLLNAPIALVLDCRRLSRSVAAIAHGYRTFDPRLQIAGVILNQVGSDRHRQMLEEALAPLDLPILGIIPRTATVNLPDRHLGLVPTDELPQLESVIQQLAHLGQSCFRWPQLLPLLKSHPPTIHPRAAAPAPPTPFTVKLAIARDRAFSFYYADNLDLLKHLGAQLLEWSPLEDRELPEEVSGLYLGGGFPEVFAAELSANGAALTAVKRAIQAGMPTYAECGGLMYLCERLITFDDKSYPMVGVLPVTVRMTQRLTLGYRRAIALRDTPLHPQGTTAWGHEFHRSALTAAPESPLYQMGGLAPDSPLHLEGWGASQWPNLHASYLHQHWGAAPEVAIRFLSRCQIWAQEQTHLPPEFSS